MPGNSYLTLAEASRGRKEVRPSDYSRIDYRVVRIGYTVGPAGVVPAAAELSRYEVWLE